MSNFKKEVPTSVFFGTPRFAVLVLEELARAGLSLDVIVTAPDRPAGRGMELQSPPVKEWALERDIPVLQPESLKKESEELAIIKNSEWDLFVVAAYGNILPKELLALPSRGTLNVHPSLLPKFRGASPIESQILADEKTVGVTIMLMDEAMDHGPIVSQASVTSEEWPLRAWLLEEILAQAGGALLSETIPAWLQGNITPEEQEHEQATYTKKIEKAYGEISLAGNAYQNYLKFCAYDGWPGIYFFKDGKRIKITNAVYKDDEFIPLKVIPEGKKEIDFKTFTG